VGRQDAYGSTFDQGSYDRFRGNAPVPRVGAAEDFVDQEQYRGFRGALQSQAKALNFGQELRFAFKKGVDDRQ